MEMIFTVYLLGFLLAVAGSQQTLSDCVRAAEAAKKLGDTIRAEQLLEVCLNEHPENITPYLRLCALYQEESRDEELYQIALQGLERFPGERRFYFVVGVRAGREGRCNQAVEVLSAGYDRWPDDQGLRRYLVDAYLCRGMDLLDAGDNWKAADDFNRLLELDPDNIVTLLNLGRAQHNMQRSSEALDTFERVFELDPETQLIRFHRGVVLYALGRFDDTVDILSRQIDRRPDHPQSYYFRGLAFLYNGDWVRALADLTVAVDGMPDSSDAVFRLGRCFDHFGRSMEAEEAFRRSARLDPSDVRPIYALGSLFSKSGRTEEAEELLNSAVDLYEKKISGQPGELRFKSINNLPRSDQPP